MIGYIKGQLIDLTPSHTYIEAHGIGYEVYISLNTYEAIKELQETQLFTHIQVKEDGWTLFGFATKDEKEAFLKLISVSGVGAATARIMLSSLTAQQIGTIIESGDTKSLEKVKGIGAKTAQRIILELKGKINVQELGNNPQKINSIHNTNENDALIALQGLGINKSLAEGAIEKAKKTIGNAPYTVEELIKSALKNL